MIEFSKDLYIDDDLLACKKEVMDNVIKGIYQKGIYVVALAFNDKNLFDIYNANELSNIYYKKRDIKVVAISNGKIKAAKLVSNIIEDMYNKQKKLIPKEYFSFA